MDKEIITVAAESAITDLKFDCRVKAVYQPSGKDTWCVQFTRKYGELCDPFHDPAGKENSAEVVREKIKRHLFRMRQPARIRIRPSQAAEESREGTFPDRAIEGIEEIISQTPQVVGKVIDQLSNVASAVEGELGRIINSEPFRSIRNPASKKKRASRKRKLAKSPVKKPVKKPKKEKKAKKVGKRSSKTAVMSRKARALVKRVERGRKKGTKNSRTTK